MKKTLIAFLMTIIVISAFAFEIPPRPIPNKLVNDYSNLLTQEQVQTLENRLVDFDQKTSIQIAVIILDDLDNEESSQVAVEIGEKWGVGQKELDNGITFLVVKYNQSAIEKLFSQKRGDVFIATGYGLEPYLTDAEAGMLLDQYFIPNVKEDKYFEAIDQTVSAIIKDLGEIGWQQRKELEAKRKAENAEAMRKVGNGMLMILILGSVGGFIIWLIVRIRRAYLKAQELKRRKKSLKANFAINKTHLESLLSEVMNDTSSYPDWAVERYQTIINTIEQAIEKPANEVIDEFPQIIETNMVRASQLLSILTNCVSELEKSLAELKNIPIDIKKYLEEAPAKLQDVEDKLKEFAKSIKDEKEKGFKIRFYEDEFTAFEESLNATKEKLEDKTEKSKEVFLESIGIKEGIENMMEDMRKNLGYRDLTSQTISTLDTQFESLATSKENALNILNQLKEETPTDNWSDLLTSFQTISELESECKKMRNTSELKNSMDVQDFLTAKQLANKAKERMEKILEIFQDISQRKEDIEKAKASYDSKLESAENAIASAEGQCDDSDVEENSKQKLIDAKDQLALVYHEKKATLPNWLVLDSRLHNAKTWANEAEEMAKNDIKTAEEARERAREAAAERARQIAARAAAAAAAARRSSYSSSSSSTSFGGGSFGGGGAGRSW